MCLRNNIDISMTYEGCFVNDNNGVVTYSFAGDKVASLCREEGWLKLYIPRNLTKIKNIDDILSIRFHQILYEGTAYNEVKYCLENTKKQNKDFKVDFYYYRVSGKEAHFVSILFPNDKSKPIYVFDSQYFDDPGSFSRNAEICKAIEKDYKRQVKNLYTDGSIQGESNLCGIYTIMFCRFASNYESLDSLIGYIQNNKEEFVSKLNSDIENLINFGPVDQKIKQNNLSKFHSIIEPTTAGRQHSGSSSILPGFGGGGS